MYRRCLIAAFAVVLAVPLLLCHWGPLVSEAAAVDKSWWSPGMDAFARWREGFNHEFGLRHPLLSLQSRLKVDLLHQSPNEQVILGRDGWLFLGQYRDYDGLADFLRARPLTADEVAGWVQHFAAKQQALAARHIPYVLVFAPNKHDIYPEYMPDGLVPGDRPSRLDQLVAALPAGGVDVLDLTEPMRQNKSWNRLYYKTDTHWNKAGSVIAYRTLLAHLHTSMPALSALDPRPQPSLPNPPTNLPMMAGALDLFSEDGGNAEFAPQTPPRQVTLAWSREHGPDAYHPRPSMYLPLGMVVTDRDEAQLDCGLVIGDSFLGYGLGDFVEQHFRHTERVFSHVLDLQQVDRLHPQIVIEEMVQEDLALQIPTNVLP